MRSILRFSWSTALRLSLAAFSVLPTAAATNVWSGSSGTDLFWSNAANWTGGALAVGTDARFFDAGTSTTPFTTTSVADALSGASVASLQFGNTNGVHAIQIPAGGNLTVNGSLVVGTPSDIAAARNITNAVTGLDATLSISAAASGLIAINQGTATSVNGSRGNLDLSSLGSFNASVNRIGIGTTSAQNPGNANQREAGSLALARTNLIVVSYTDTLANYQTANKLNAIELSRNPGNNGSIVSLLFLGVTNAIYADSMGFGRDKASTAAGAWMGFNPAFTNENPVAYFRGAAGDASRVTWWAMGDMNANASSAQHSVGTNDFRGGRVDALVNTMSLGRDCSPSHSASGGTRINMGVLVFDNGLIDVNTMYVGNQSLGPATSVTPNQGFVTVGPNATLRVNNNLVLGNTVQSGTAAALTFGRVQVNGGVLMADTISTGAASTNSSIGIASGSLILSNTLGTVSKSLKGLNLTNATVTFHVKDTATSAYVTDLVTDGTNTISLATIPVYPSYPVQLTLASYTRLSGAGFNFTLGPVPGSAPGAYLSNNVANNSIDLVLPIDPKPVITSLPASYGGSPGDTVTFTAAYTGSEPVTLSWLKDSAPVSNGTAASGSVISGASTSALTINNAQASDSGPYVLVASNPYGSVTSSPPASLIISTGDIAPIVNGPANLTVIQGHDAHFSATVSGKPVPTLQWYKGVTLLTGQTAANLTIASVQYPEDQAAYSIVAENSAGRVTNSATLTVIVTPSIAVQPVNMAVTNSQPAAFSVVSTNGVPAPTFQWKKNGNNIPGATTDTLNFSSASPADMGTYTVQIANAAGSVTSDPVTLTVNSTMAVSATSPAHAAQNICFDTPLKVTFSSPPVLRKAGAIRIYNATNSDTPVDTINLALNTDNHPVYAANVQSRLIGGEGFVSFPVIITGNSATIYPHAGVLTSNQTYFVNIDPGAFADAAGAFFTGIAGSGKWVFSTKASLPYTAATNPIVAANGSGDFMTVQGALDSLPSTSATRRLIEIRDGLYTEIINIKKANVTLRGQSRAGTILAFPNNANLQGSTHFRMSFKMDANDVAVESLTITNSTPKGGGQAEALMIESDRARFIALNTSICSFQDTILLNTEGSQAYFIDSLIQGDTDFIWGSGNVFFTNCEIKQLNASTALNPTSSTGLTNHGMSFVNCSFTRAPGLTGASMGRTRSIPNGNAAIIYSRIDDHVFGWSTDALPTSSYRLWDFGNSNITATASKVLTNCIALTAGDERIALATNATAWLSGWVPQLAPNILAGPLSKSVAGGTPVSLSVSATGLPTPQYQWTSNGTNIPGATTATLRIPAASMNDSGDYAVVVSNPSGAVTSAAATLTVGNSAPALASVENLTVNAGVTVTITNIATDPDLPLQTLSFQLVQGPVNAAIDAATGVFTFRPLVSQAASSNWFLVRVSDNATPSASAESGFGVIVNPMAPITAGVSGWNGGSPVLTISGDPGPDYTITASTNLLDWEPVFTINSPPFPFNWSDPTAATHPARFYRIQAGP